MKPIFLGLLVAILLTDLHRALAQVDPETTASFRWGRAADASLARQELYPAVLNGKVYVAGGVLTPPTGLSAHFEAYDVQAGRWKELSPLPEARHHIGLAEANGLIYGIGGFSGGFPFWRAQSSVFVYDPGTDRWTAGSSLPEAQAEGVVATVGGQIYSIGGRIASQPGASNFNDHLDTARGYVLDPESGHWTRIANAPSARNSAAGAVIDGKIYVVGGRQATKQSDGRLRQINVPSLEIYDPESNRWEVKSPMPQAQGGLAAAAHGGRLYVFGGEQWIPEHKVFAESWMYDPATDKWSNLPPLPTPRHGLGAGTVGDRIYVVGRGEKVGGGQASPVHEVLVIQNR